ncbi:glycosyltransferase family 4 protein [soil metagenome]
MSVTLATLIGAAAFATAAIGVHIITRYALRIRLIDVPNDRSSHTTPTPRGGGLALVVITVGGLVASSMWLPQLRTTQSLMAVVCFAVIAVISWMDDLRSLPNGLRLLVHVSAASVIAISIGSIDTLALPWVGSVSLGWSAPLVTVIWIVGLTNAYNFMDGIDGIAGIQTIVAGVGLTILGLLISGMAISVVGALLAGSAAGFLVHNWEPARIFMGDVGSAFVGFCIAAAVTAGAQLDDRFALAGALLVAPFIIDTCYTFARRLRNGENLFRAHRSHMYQRLVIAGLGHGTVSMVFGLAAAVGAGVGVLWLWRSAHVEILVAAYPVVLALGLYMWVRTIERRSTRRATPPIRAESPLAAKSARGGGP